MRELTKADKLYIFFDTETTGVPRDYKAPTTDTRNWPRMVQLGWILMDSKENKLSQKDYIIRPDVMNSKRTYCTMQAGTDFCLIPGRYGYKGQNCKNYMSSSSVTILMALTMP